MFTIEKECRNHDCIISIRKFLSYTFELHFCFRTRNSSLAWSCVYGMVPCHENSINEHYVVVPFQDLGKFDACVQKGDVSEYRFSGFGFRCVIDLNA